VISPVVLIGTPPPPHPQASVSPPSFGSGGGGYTLAAGEGGVPIPTRGQTLWYSRYLYMHFVFAGIGEGHYTVHRQYAYMCEILVDRKFFAHFVRNKAFLCLKIGCVKMCIQKKVLASLWSGSGFESGPKTNFRTYPDPKPQNFCFGSATLVSDVLTVAGIPAFVGFLGIVGVSAVAFIHAIADVPAFVGVSAILVSYPAWS
jgi:hypothetical protein